MRRRQRPDEGDEQAAALVAAEAEWWLVRSMLDEPLSLEEFRRHAALTQQRVDVRAAIWAILDRSTASRTVRKSYSDHAREEYVRASLGRPSGGA